MTARPLGPRTRPRVLVAGRSGSRARDPRPWTLSSWRPWFVGLMAGETAGEAPGGVEWSTRAWPPRQVVGTRTSPKERPRSPGPATPPTTLAAVLTAVTRTPATVLDVLAPSLPGADPFPGTQREGPGASWRRRVQGAPPWGAQWEELRGPGTVPLVDGSYWAWVAARAQGSGPACLEALTAAVASASTLRYRSAAPTSAQPLRGPGRLAHRAGSSHPGGAWTPPPGRPQPDAPPPSCSPTP